MRAFVRWEILQSVGDCARKTRAYGRYFEVPNAESDGERAERICGPGVYPPAPV